MKDDMPDPTELMLNDAAYDELLKDAATDKRVGPHELMVSKVVNDKWPSGDPRTKITFVILTANNKTADMTWSVPPSVEEVKTKKAEWPEEKVRGIAGAITLARQCIQHYGKTPDQLREGERVKGQTVKTRRDAEGKGGFIRVVAFLAKDHAVGEQATQAAAAAAAEPTPDF
jgi:hypothetical protein